MFVKLMTKLNEYIILNKFKFKLNFRLKKTFK